MKDMLLIIGGSGEIGESIVDSFYDQYDLIVTYNKNPPKNNKIFKSYQLDLSVNDSIDGTIKKIFLENKIKKVVVAAGVMTNNLLISTTNKELNNMVDIDVKGQFILLRELVKSLITNRKDYKNLVVISSLAGEFGNEGQSLYSMTKGCVIPLIKSISREYGSRKLIANVLSLSVVSDTDMEQTIPKNKIDLIKNNIPLKRFCNKKDINLAIDFLLKTEYYNGQVMSLNGGII